jgi:hypothetical protein
VSEGDSVKGYIYITGDKADPGLYNNLNDPLFENIPTLGACMPNLREWVNVGDYLFVVSGKAPGVQQYVIGGMRVAEKIDALAAFGRFRANRLRMGEDGLLKGNVVVGPDGKKHPLDKHKLERFENRIENFIVGTDAVALQTEREIALGREQSLRKLSEIFERPGNRPFDILGRQRRMNENQINGLVDWLRGIKASVE